jgi:hypothetical protein
MGAAPCPRHDYRKIPTFAARILQTTWKACVTVLVNEGKVGDMVTVTTFTKNGETIANKIEAKKTGSEA